MAVTAMLAVAVAVVLGCIELCGAFGGPTVRQGSLLGDNPMNALWGIEASRRASRHAMLDIPTHDARVRVRRLDSGAAPDVHGRAAVTHRTGRWMPPCGGRDAPRPPRTAEVRFEITEAGTRVTRA